MAPLHSVLWSQWDKHSVSLIWFSKRVVRQSYVLIHYLKWFRVTMYVTEVSVTLFYFLLNKAILVKTTGIFRFLLMHHPFIKLMESWVNLCFFWYEARTNVLSKKCVSCVTLFWLKYMLYEFCIVATLETVLAGEINTRAGVFCYTELPLTYC